MFSPLVPIWMGRGTKGVIWWYAVACIVFDVNGFVLKNLQIERYWGSNLFFLIELLLTSAYFIRYVFSPMVGRIAAVAVVLAAVNFIAHTYQVVAFENNCSCAGLMMIAAYYTHCVSGSHATRAGGLLLIVLAVYYFLHTIFPAVLEPNYKDTAIFYGLYIIFSLLGLYKVVKEVEFVRIEHSPIFIFSIAFLILASGTFIILLFEVEAINAYRKVMEGLWTLLHNPLNIIKNLLLGYGLWLVKKKR